MAKSGPAPQLATSEALEDRGCAPIPGRREGCGPPECARGPQNSEARSYGAVRSPEVAEITGAGREWTVSMITLYADVRIEGVIRTSALSELG